MQTALKRIAGAGSAAALALTVAAVTAQPASADVKTFNDGGKYLTTVKVRHGSENLRVKARVGDYKIGSHFAFWLDTDPDDAGPEYRVKVYPNTEVVPIRAVENFSDNGTDVPCDYRASADAGGSKYVEIVIPRSCLGNPDKVRVSVRARLAVPGPNVTDWGPARKKFFGWVAS